MERKIHTHAKDLQRPRLGKPRRGLQNFNTGVDFPVPVQREKGRDLAQSCDKKPLHPQNNPKKPT